MDNDGFYYIVTVHIFARSFATTKIAYRVHARNAIDAGKAAEQQARIDYINVVYSNAIRIEQE